MSNGWLWTWFVAACWLVVAGVALWLWDRLIERRWRR